MPADIQKFQQQLKEGQLRQLFDFLPGVYFVVKNREGLVMMAYQVAVRLCGFNSEQEMVGKTDHDIFSPERADAYVEDDRPVFETGKSIVDRVELAPDPNNSTGL